MFTDAQIREAARARRAALAAPGDQLARAAEGARLPADVARSQPFRAQMRAQAVKVDGKDFVRLAGVASSYDQPYQIWDMFGPYMESVAPGAGAASLAAGPDVVFLVNHKGLSLARTVNSTLTLAETDEGLTFEALCNPKRTDAADLLAAVEDGVVTECSFAFRITSGDWSPDYSAYTITGYDINRGDVSACTYGANPATSIEARALALRALESLDGGALRAVHESLGARLRSGGSTRYGQALADLQRMRDGVRERALSPADTATLTVLLTQIVGAEAGLDPIVEALCAADCVLDTAQATLATLLGLPNPDPEDATGEPMQQNSGPSLAFLRAQLDAGRI